jgi:hypothetical protein
VRIAKLGALVLGLAIACHKGTPPGADAATAAETMVPMPEGLLAEAIIGAPNTFWTKLQRGVGGPLAILPSTFGALVCVAGGIDPTAGDLVDGAAPAFAVVGLDGQKLAYAIAVRLNDPTRARAILLDGDAGRFAAKEDGDRKLTVLAARGAPGPMAAAIAGSYLVLARNEDDLLRFGPYAYRTVPSHPNPTADARMFAPHEGLVSLRAHLISMWDPLKTRLRDQDLSTRAQHGGRAPDYGDPAAIVDALDGALQARLAVLGDLDAAELTLETSGDELHAGLSLVPLPDKGPASQLFDTMLTGDAAPLGALPADVTVGVLIRDDPVRRPRDVADMSLALKAIFVDRIAATDAKNLTAALSDWAAARGDWLTVALNLDTPSVSLRTPTPRPELATRAVHEAVDILRVAPFKDFLAARLTISGGGVSDVKFGDAGSPAALATFVYRAGPEESTRPKATTFGVTWMTDNDQLYLAVAKDAGGRMQMDLHPPSTLNDDPRTATALRALSGTASFALVARPFAPRDGEPRPHAVFGWGQQKGVGQARLEVSDALLRELLRSQMAL